MGRKTRHKGNDQRHTLGTFAGVFPPGILTILGIANAIAVLTSVSLSAFATNLKVKGGGHYYLISRTLGLEFGGAIGVVLFLAQAASAFLAERAVAAGIAFLTIFLGILRRGRGGPLVSFSAFPACRPPSWSRPARMP
jgi:amino acid transporter